MVTYPKDFIGPIPPTVQPTPQTPQGNLTATMTTPPPTTTTPEGLQFAPPPTATQNTGQSNQFGLAQVMGALETQTTKNNALMTQRNLLLKHLYDQPLTPEEQQQLDPTLLPAVQKNDRSQIDMSLRLISDEIKGRTGTLDSSVKFLADAYHQQVADTETAKQNAISNVLDFAKTYGSNARSAMESLYGKEYVDKLAGMGINVDAFAAVPTITQTQAGIEVTPTLGNQVGSIGKLPTYDTATTNPTLNRPTRNQNPGNIKYSSATAQYPGVIGVESRPASDGGNFLIFDSVQSGLNAIGLLLQNGKSYQGVTAEKAIKAYSGGSYGAMAVGLDPKADFQSQIADETTKDAVVQAIAQREGFSGGGASTPKLSDEAIDLAANQYITTGQMPALGVGSSPQVRAARTAILNRAAELASGTIPGVNKAKLAALGSTLTEQTKYLNTIQRSINTVDDNLKILQEAATHVNNSGAPIVNQLTNNVKLKTGDGALNAFRAAIQTVRAEYSQILARGGQVTDAVRGEANTLIPDNISLAQLNKVIDVLKQEAQNVVGNAQTQVDTVQGQMDGILTGGKTPNTSTTPTGTSYQDYLKSIGQ